MTDIALCQHRLGLIDDSGAVAAPQALQLDDDGVIPNNTLPALLYRGDANDSEDAPREIEALFQVNGWPPQWRGSVFAFNHYHSTAHEVLGVWGGWARIQLGGELGPMVLLEAGDVIVLPAGVGHGRVDRGGGFGVVGGYPANQPNWDLCRADPSIHDAAAARIARVPLPTTDPVEGTQDPLMRYWRGD